MVSPPLQDDQALVANRWPVRIRRIQRGAVVLSFVSVATAAMPVLLSGGVRGTFVALAVSASGVVMSLRRPAWGLGLTVLGPFVAVVLGADVTTEWSVVAFTLLSATLAGVPPLRAGVVVSGALYVLLRVSEGGDALTPTALTAASAAAAAAAIGGGVRAQWRYTVVLQERAADAVAAGQREFARALVEERLRIARDLHDLVGHEVAVVNMHIGVAEVSLPPGAERPAEELAAARGALQSVLTQTQQILELLRRRDDEPSGGRPAPGLDEVAGLVESFRRSGHEVDADLGSLAVADLGPAVWLTVYRVVQEALTNAHRYGDGATRLTVSPAAGSVVVSVSNLRSSDPDRAGAGTGHGLVGMRERVTAVGGSLDVRGGDEEFRLTVVLPTNEGSSS